MAAPLDLTPDAKLAMDLQVESLTSAYGLPASAAEGLHSTPDSWPAWQALVDAEVNLHAAPGRAAAAAAAIVERSTAASRRPSSPRRSSRLWLTPVFPVRSGDGRVLGGVGGDVEGGDAGVGSIAGSPFEAVLALLSLLGGDMQLDPPRVVPLGGAGPPGGGGPMRGGGPPGGRGPMDAANAVAARHIAEPGRAPAGGAGGGRGGAGAAREGGGGGGDSGALEDVMLLRFFPGGDGVGGRVDGGARGASEDAIGALPTRTVGVASAPAAAPPAAGGGGGTTKATAAAAAADGSTAATSAAASPPSALPTSAPAAATAGAAATTPDGAAATSDTDRACAVCLSDFAVGEVLRDLRCGHAFHQTCIDTWLGVCAVCPLCKADLDGRPASAT